MNWLAIVERGVHEAAGIVPQVEDEALGTPRVQLLLDGRPEVLRGAAAEASTRR